MIEELPDDIDNDELDDVEPVGDEAQLYEHFRVVVDKGQEMMRVDKYLFDRLTNSSRNRIQKAADAGFVMANGKAVKSSYKVKPLDEIVILLDRPKYDNEIIAEDIPLDIVYEDEDLMVVDKPAGLVVHPGCGNYTGTLVNAIAWHLKDNPDYDPNDPTVGLVHRIDKDTSGLLVVAKNADAKTQSGQTVLQQNHQKDCTMPWSGENFQEEEGRIEGNIARHPKDRMQMAVSRRQRNRETCRHPLPRTGEFQLCHARGMQAGNRTYPSDPRPYGRHRSSRCERSSLWGVKPVPH